MVKTIIAIVGFVLAGALFFLFTKPTYATVGDVQAQISQYQEALNKAAQVQQLKQKLLTRYNSFNPDDINRLQTMIPDHVDNIGLILELDNIASRYGMALENIDVSPGAAASADKTGPIGAIGGGNQKYESLTFHFSTFGTYENFRTFLHDLEASLRIVDLVSLNITAAPPAQGATASAGYTFDITLKTYWLK